MLLQPPGARARSGLFAPDGACGDVVRASTPEATATPQPTGSTSVASPVASSLAVLSATRRQPGRRCQPAACAPCPRCLEKRRDTLLEIVPLFPCAVESSGS